MLKRLLMVVLGMLLISGVLAVNLFDGYEDGKNLCKTTSQYELECMLTLNGEIFARGQMITMEYMDSSAVRIKFDSDLTPFMGVDDKYFFIDRDVYISEINYDEAGESFVKFILYGGVEALGDYNKNLDAGGAHVTVSGGMQYEYVEPNFFYKIWNSIKNIFG